MMLDLIVNPSAGGKSGEKIRSALKLVEARLIERNVNYKVHKAELNGQTTELTRTLIDNGAENIVVMGGDGTLHAAINGFHSFERVNMGIIPCGTGNDFAYALGIPLDPVKAIDLIVDGQPKYTDFMQMPTVRGLNVIGMGIDVEVLKRYSMLKNKTKWGYTKSLIKTLFKFKPFDFTATMNGEEKARNSFICAVANGCVFGGGIPVCPVADTSDGLLNFVAVKGMNKLSLIGAFMKLKAGKILTIKQAEHVKSDGIKASTPLPYTVNVDGELYENIPFEVKVVSNTLKIYR